MREIIAVLHHIRSIHNVGSIFRTADGVGIKKLYLCGITPTPLDRFGNYRKDFQKVSLGAERSVAWEHFSSLSRAYKKLKIEGFLLVAVEQSKKSVSYERYRPRSKKIALVFGNEVRGLSKSALERVNVVVEIPMRGGKESLNVAVAFGIIAYHFTNQ
ncbi:MAG: TrmH family RNA methyltransferase [Patescibacteria group bacterium]